MLSRKHVLSFLSAGLLTITSQLSLAGTGQIVIINGDSAGEGLNDPTHGAARLAAFNKAADILNAKLDIDVNVEVRATFDPLSCTANSATLGQAGASFGGSLNTNSGSIQANVSYPIGLFNELMGSEQNSLFGAGAPTHEINAQFNSNLGQANCLAGSGWDYSLTSAAPGTTAFLPVVLHEILHGLGFSSAISSNGSGDSNGNFSIYDQFLVDGSNTRLIDMNQSARSQEITGNDLWWNGTNVKGSNSNTNARMYAPNPYEGGSSTSHFDTSFSSPNQLMEPQYTVFMDDIGLAEQLLEDLGWTMQAAVANSAPVFSSASSLNTVYSDAINHTLTATDANNDSLTFSLTSHSSNQLTVSLTGNSLTITPTNNYTGSSSINVAVTDGVATTNQSINVTVLNDFALTFNSNNYSPDDVITTGLNATAFTLSGGGTIQTVSVDYQGSDRSSLLTQSGSSYTLAVPTSGAFAGRYEVEVTDTSGNNASFVIERPVRLIASHDDLVTASTNQQLHIEGAAAGTILDITVTSGSNYLDVKNASTTISQITAVNNAAQFNRTSVNLAPKNISQDETATVRVNHTQIPSADKSFDILLTKTLQLKVVDSANLAIANALIEITNDSRLTGWGLAESVTTATDGTASIIVVNDQTPQLSVTASGFALLTQAAQLIETEQLLSLSAPTQSINITGTVSTNNLNFTQLELEAALMSDNESKLLATISNVTAQSFDYSVTYDGATFTAASIVFSAGDVSSSKTIESQQQQSINAELNAQATPTEPVETPQPDVNNEPTTEPSNPPAQNNEPVVVTISSSGGGGAISLTFTLGWTLMLILITTITSYGRSYGKP